jgi:hypothetical protein
MKKLLCLTFLFTAQNIFCLTEQELNELRRELSAKACMFSDTAKKNFSYDLECLSHNNSKECLKAILVKKYPRCHKMCRPLHNYKFTISLCIKQLKDKRDLILDQEKIIESQNLEKKLCELREKFKNDFAQELDLELHIK